MYIYKVKINDNKKEIDEYIARHTHIQKYIEK